MTTVGRIRELWRYPVKSMGGEQVAESRLTAGGLPGDRAWAVRDEMAGEIRGGKKLPALMQCTARFLAEPAPGTSSEAEILFPDGTVRRTSAEDVSSALTALVGRAVTLCPLRPADDLDHYRRGQPDSPDMLEELRGIFGREEGEPLPDLSVFPPEVLEFTSPLGTYFDAFPLHLLTTASLDTLGAAAPGSDFDRRRFRPNLLVDTAPAALAGLPEASWSGRHLRIGSALLQCVMPTVRCSMTIQPQPGLPRDPAVLRAVVREGDQNVGAYAVVVEAGAVRAGDDVVLLD